MQSRSIRRVPLRALVTSFLPILAWSGLAIYIYVTWLKARDVMYYWFVAVLWFVTNVFFTWGILVTYWV